MLRKKEIVIVLLAGMFCLGTAFCQEQAQEAPDPYEDTSVLVEAFVIRVSNAALAEAGVNSIGQSPEGISISKILWCLKDTEKAKVVSGSKLMARNNEESQSNNEERVTIKSERVNRVPGPEAMIETKDVTFSEYTSGIKFQIRPCVQTENTVSVAYSYSETGIHKKEDPETPPSLFSYDWKGYLTAQSGKPVIAGATQGQDETTFLILTATIQDSGDFEKKTSEK